MNSTTFQASTFAKTSLLLLAIVSALVLAGCCFVMPTRVWGSGLIAAYMVLTVALGALVFIALEYATAAGWSVVFRRVPEALAMSLPLLGVAMVAIVAVGANTYQWHPEEGHEVGTFWFKELWLTPGFLVARAVAYVVVWSLLAWAVVGVSRRQDRTGDVKQTFINRRLSALVLVVFAPTFSLAACDWLMSLEPMWFSTVWGAYHFAGLAMSTLATVVLLALYLRRVGPLRKEFSDDHLHDLGKLLFGFSCFWMYLWFSQYMLIWYSNIPEETSYFIPRTQGAWGPLMIANLALNWFLPFMILLPRAAKRSPVIMARIAMLVLFGRWLDLYLMVFPSTDMEAAPERVHEAAWEVIARIPEIAAVVLAASLLCLLFFRCFSQAPAVPVGDPLLGESRHLGAHVPHAADAPSTDAAQAS